MNMVLTLGDMCNVNHGDTYYVIIAMVIINSGSGTFFSDHLWRLIGKDAPHLVTHRAPFSP